MVTTLAQGPGEVKLPGGVMEPNGVTWLDRAGNYLSHTAHGDRAVHQMGDNHIQYSATIEDPELYTQPVDDLDAALSPVEPNAQLLEFRCVPFSELLLYGDLLEEDAARSRARNRPARITRKRPAY